MAEVTAAEDDSSLTRELIQCSFKPQLSGSWAKKDQIKEVKKEGKSQAQLLLPFPTLAHLVHPSFLNSSSSFWTLLGFVQLSLPSIDFLKKSSQDFVLARWDSNPKRQQSVGLCPGMMSFSLLNFLGINKRGYYYPSRCSCGAN